MCPPPRSTWRLIRSAPADGATQMAVDEAVWQAVAQGWVPPTLRLYGWEPPCLSLGRHQPLAEVDRKALHRAGHGLVRRPTGGRAILHADELTYSVAVPLTDPRVRGGVLESCQRLSEGLVEALRLLGVRNVAAHQGGQRLPPTSPVCFEAPSPFEITVDGRKLIGSAQMRGRGTLLQHGSLPLHGDIARICAFLTTQTDPRRVLARATTLAAVLGRPVSWEEAASAVAEGFARALDLRLEQADLTPQERELAERLRVEKYGAEEWTARR